MKYFTNIGLEVHVQLKTETKLFCSCSCAFGEEPNTLTCPVCLGLPGTLPVLNSKTIEFAVMAAAALNCKISNTSVFARKNYFYPDLPKGYQITQYEYPLAVNGYLDINILGENKRINIKRIHIEEDAGKSIHPEGRIDVNNSMLDYNRCGIPLIEIVSEPDISSAEEAYKYLVKLKQILKYLGISDCSMEEGSLRCDANVSIRKKNTSSMGNRTEIKNLNSFKYVKKAIIEEIKRQVKIIELDEVVETVTLSWNEKSSTVNLLRSKEESDDYRYFPEPDLPTLKLNHEELKTIIYSLPELPDKKLERFIKQYSIPEDNALTLTSSVEIADYFEKAAIQCKFYIKLANWILVEVMKLTNEKKVRIDKLGVPPENLAKLVNLIETGKISGKSAKSIFPLMVTTGHTPEKIITQEGFEQISDQSVINKYVTQILNENPELVNQYKAGKQKLLGFFIGEIMKKSRGNINPELATRILEKKLN